MIQTWTEVKARCSRMFRSENPMVLVNLIEWCVIDGVIYGCIHSNFDKFKRLIMKPQVINNYGYTEVWMEYGYDESS